MREIHSTQTLDAHLAAEQDLHGCVIQGLDLSESSWDWANLKTKGAVFLGCRFAGEHQEHLLLRSGALIFPPLENLPYHPYRPRLYTQSELLEGYSESSDQSLDKRIYDHFVSKGRDRPDVCEALAQRLHDHAIDDGLQDLLEGEVEPGGAKKVVAIMGGHGTSRADPYYTKTAQIARALTRRGYFIASGGGPGIMEAANLGAYLARVRESDLFAAIDRLQQAPYFTDSGYHQAAQEIIDRHPKGCSSIAIPTWFYGHEPSNLFSTWVAKYFSNSIREDGLLAIATYGVVYAPGSAGTSQEIFMDATQNHYGTFRYVSPMVFLGREHYISRTRLFPTLKRLAAGRQYESLLAVYDSPASVVRFLTRYQLTEISKSSSS